MHTLKNNPFKKSSIFFSISMLQLAGAYLMYPLYIKYFTVEEFGYNDLFNKSALLLSIIIAFRIHAAMSNLYFDYSNSFADKKKFMGTLLSFTLISSFITGIVTLLSGYLIKQTIPLFFTFSAIAIAVQISLGSLYIFHLRNDSALKQFIVYNLISILSLFGWQYFAMVFQNKGFQTIIEIRGYHSLFLIVNTSFALFLKFGLQWHFSILKKCLQYSIGLLPFVIINWGQLYVDRWYLQGIGGAYEMGIYSFYLTVGLIHGTIAEAFENAWRPNLIQQLKAGVAGFSDWIKNTQTYLLITNATAAGAVLLTALLPYFINIDKFRLYLYLIFPVMILACLKAHVLLILQPMVFLKKSLSLSIFVAIQLVMLLVSYFIWLKKPDLNILLSINILVSAFILILMFMYTQKMSPLPYSLKMFMPSVVFVITCILGWIYTKDTNSYITAIAAGILGIQIIPAVIKSVKKLF